MNIILKQGGFQNSYTCTLQKMVKKRCTKKSEVSVHPSWFLGQPSVFLQTGGCHKHEFHCLVKYICEFE